MIRKLFLILFALSAYIYVVSTDPEGNLIFKAKKFYSFCKGRYIKMNLKYHVKKWPDTKPKKRYYWLIFLAIFFKVLSSALTPSWEERYPSYFLKYLSK